MLQQSGKLGNAEEQFRKALKISENLTAEFPTKSYYWLQYTHSLGRSIADCSVETGRPTEAEQLHREASRGIRRKVFGEDSDQVGWSLNQSR